MLCYVILYHVILYYILYYTRSALEDSRLFGPSPLKILAATGPMTSTYPSNPAPGENLLSGNLVMETGCTYYNITQHIVCYNEA